MLKAIFGLLGLAVVLAIAGSLAKSQLGAIAQLGQTTARVLGPPGLAATAGAPMPPAQPRAREVQKSVFERQDDALQQSEQRYKRADP
jgi:hypothetical protein